MFGSDDVPALDAATIFAVEKLRENGRTTMVVRHGQRDLGTIGLMDTPRADAKGALQELREIGITRMIMISGDHQKVADAVASEVGLDEAWGNLMPEDKVEAIRKLRQTTKVAMVGDGVNDAPAMANSTVGIAMGAAGSDVALETADVALMADDLKIFLSCRLEPAYSKCHPAKRLHQPGRRCVPGANHFRLKYWCCGRNT
jgi:Cd2+/Zn2+-exporting ATPase